MNNNPMTLDIVLPLYNEEKILTRTVDTLINFLNKNKFPYEYVITLVNNASTDSSKEIAESLAQKYKDVRVINLGKKGKGIAIRTAWERSDKDILSFMDVDLASDLNFFKPLVDAVAEDRCDMSIGNRLGKESKIIDRRFHREIMSQFYNFLVRIFLGTGLDDHQCGFKVMSASSFKKIAPYLKEDGFFIDTELITISKLKDFKIVPFDIVWTDARESKVSFANDSVKMFAAIFRLKSRLRLYK